MQLKNLQPKRAVTAVLFVLLTSAVAMTNALAQSFTVGNLNYTITGASTVTVNGHVDGTNATGSITIPASVNYNMTNYTVTAVANSAFSGCTGITAVYYNAVNANGNSYWINGTAPFIGCGGTLTIGENVEHIPARMFTQAAFTGSLTIPNSVTTIGESAFNSCSGFNGSLTIGNGVTTIGGSAFAHCTGFTGDMTLTHELSYLGGSAFYNCNGLTGSPNIVLTGTIEGYVFAECSNLGATITIGENVATVGNCAFRNCGNITAVHFNAINATDINQDYASPFKSCGGTLTIGENVQRIPNYMFYEGSFTGGLTIPNGVTEIGSYAFEKCTGFNGSLTIPNSVTTIGKSAFRSCTGFNGSLSIGNGVTTIGETAFYGCTGFTGDLTLTHELSYLGGSAFYNCNGLTGSPSIVLTGTIGSYALSGCSNLAATITIGENVTTVGNCAFRSCGNITAVHYNTVNAADISQYYDLPFEGCGGTLEIGENVERIPNYMFRNANITAIHSLDTVPPTIGTNAFQNVNQNIPVIVPCGSLAAYQNANGWSTFTNIDDDCPEPHEIAATANPTIGGNITGVGTYYVGNMATLTATPNEGFTFVNWTKEGTVVSTNPTYSFMVTEDASFEANFEMIIITQTTTLASGWNWWSTYIGQNYIDGLSLLEESLDGKGAVIESQSGSVEYSSSTGWTGSLQAISNESSYLIQVTEDCTSTINGPELQPENHPITLNPGWTWIGYPVNQSQTICTALGNYAPAVNDVLKGQGDYAVYLPDIGWFPPTFTLNPGTGYMYYSMQEGAQTLVYANSREETSVIEPVDRFWQNDIHAYADNLCLMAVVTIDGNEQRSENLELGAFVNGECRGSARLIYIEPLDRYYALMTVTGQNGEVVEFDLVDEGRHVESAISTTRLTFNSNAIIGTFDAPFGVSFDTKEPLIANTQTLNTKES